MTEDAFYRQFSPEAVPVEGDDAYRWVVECEDCDYRTQWCLEKSARRASDSHEDRDGHTTVMTEAEGIDLTEDADDE